MNDSFVLFWDVRNTNLLGGYWDTFGDDVTELKFHPDNPNSLVGFLFFLPYFCKALQL
jgi:hypothetical protein